MISNVREGGLPVPDGDGDRERIRQRQLTERRRFQAQFREALGELGALTADLEQRALCLMTAGMEYEKTGEYETAAELYRQGLACEPGDRFCAYFLHNNYGFCLNVLGRHAEAEWYCRTAIELDPSRPNGFKNLGISLEARSEYEAAIEAWIAATRVFPEDPRSLGHLEQLLDEQPHLEGGLGLGETIDGCRRAVHEALARQRQRRESGRRGQ